MRKRSGAKAQRRTWPSGRSRQEFVAFDPSRNALPAGHRIDAQNASVATNVDVTGEGDLLGQGEHEFDGRVGLERRGTGEVKPAETDVASFPGLFDEIVRRQLRSALS
jgi:hypothetical protein